MSISSRHHDLFHQPSAAEKISFLRSLIETGDLHADVATAWLKSIHSELAQLQGRDHSLYASYVRTMAALQHKMPDVHQQVVTNWQASRTVEAHIEASDEPEGYEARVEEPEKPELESSKEAEEGEHMAMEATEAAAHMEQEEPGNEQPPSQAAE